MIIKEYFSTREDGVNLFKSYSDLYVMIRKKGTEELYDSAIDVENSTFVYEETDIPTEDVTEPQELQD